ncbi:MAG: CHAP domain-containing protein [bacterium]|nr:CHAP domain-containing protein [bacterium]
MKTKKSDKKKIILNGVASIAVAAAGVVAIINSTITDKANAKTAEQLQAEINALEAQESEALAQAQALGEKAKTLENELASIASQKAAIEKQIEIAKAKHQKLQLDIKATEKAIEDNRKALGVILAEMSVEEEITPIERLASSENLSTALDNLEYQSSVKDSLVEKVSEIKKQKEQLKQQEQEVQVEILNQEKAESALKDKINEQNKLIAETQNQEAAYQEYASARSAEKAKLQKQQQDIIAAALAAAAARSGGSITTIAGATTSYPWNASNCYMDANAWSHGGADGNGTDGFGYGCRQCVSYTAWRLFKETGYQARFWGNANQWPASARAAGFSTGTTPRPGSLGVISSGAYGHIVWVESVDGNYVVISQYNYFNAGGSGWGHYSQMRVPASTYDTYIYVK